MYFLLNKWHLKKLVVDVLDVWPVRAGAVSDLRSYGFGGDKANPLRLPGLNKLRERV
jgi:hypothetical protein